MEHVVNLSSCRKVTRIACVNSSSVPTPTATEPVFGDDGVFKISDSPDTMLAAHTGVSSAVKVFPGSAGSVSYTLTIYGMVPWGAVGVDGFLWVATPLYKGSVVSDMAADGGDKQDDVVETGDMFASAITETTGAGTGSTQTTSYGSSVGPAHVIVDTRGCPYLYFVANQDDAFVGVGGLS